MPGSVRRVTAMGLGTVSGSQVLAKGCPFATWSSGMILVWVQDAKGSFQRAALPLVSPMAPIADGVPIPTLDIPLARLEGPVSKVVLALV